MTDVRMFDLNNGDVVVFFGDVYCHIYNKADMDSVKADVKAYREGEDTSSWDNNELEYITLEQVLSDETLEEIEI